MFPVAFADICTTPLIKNSTVHARVPVFEYEKVACPFERAVYSLDVKAPVPPAGDPVVSVNDSTLTEGSFAVIFSFKIAFRLWNTSNIVREFIFTSAKFLKMDT